MPFAPRDPITLTPEGLFCPPGNFHIDPWKPVRKAVTTHAHADHIGFGSQRFLTSTTGAHILRSRVDDAPIDTLPWNTPTRVGDVLLSLHPAGHVRGSAQVRLTPASDKHTFPTTVITGDYRLAAPSSPSHQDTNPAAEPFQPVTADLLLTESTFGLPVFTWPAAHTVAQHINAWWADNAANHRTSVLFCYALGKAQRVLALLDHTIGPIALHGSAIKPTAAYEHTGVTFPPHTHATKDNAKDLKGRAAIIAPGSTNNTPWLRQFKGPDGLRTAFVSGWMRTRGKRRWRAADAGFTLSDHADWPGLLHTINTANPERVAVTHGYAEPLARFINETTPRHAFAVPTRFTGDSLTDDAESPTEPNNP